MALAFLIGLVSWSLIRRNAQPGVNVEPEPDPEPIVNIEPKPDPEPEPDPEPIVSIEPKPDPEPEPDPEPIVSIEPEPDPEPIVNIEPEPDPEPEVDIVKELNKGIDNQHYRTTKIPDDEIVQGKKGDYYWIDIKDAETLEILLFEAGRYKIGGLNRRFGESIQSFYSDTIEPIKNNGKNWDLFLQGSADYLGHENFQGELKDVDCQPEDFRSISVHPPIQKDSTDLYSIKSIDKPIQNTMYKNEHLPNLRARFMQCKLQQIYDLKSEILDGYVKDLIGEEYRNVYLILFIERNSVKAQE
ncbi:MAG: hypothetical protein AAGA80_08575 [Cyanobacteria bacterium P01_F01_bin.143]